MSEEQLGPEAFSFETATTSVQARRCLAREWQKADHEYLSLLSSEAAGALRRQTQIELERGELLLGFGEREIDFSYFGYQSSAEARQALDLEDSPIYSDQRILLLLTRQRLETLKKVEEELLLPKISVAEEKYSQTVEAYEAKTGKALSDYLKTLMRLNPEKTAEFFSDFLSWIAKSSDAWDDSVFQALYEVGALGRLFKDK